MVLTFGDIELDPGLRELRRSGVRLAIQPKVFRLLCFLIEHRDRVVTKEELLGTVWACERVVPEVLSTAIRALRRVLGDDPKNPTYVQTVHRVGYRFIADLVEFPVSSGDVDALSSPVVTAHHAAFIGRESEKFLFVKCISDPHSTCQVLWVHGPAGIGKTTLLRELMHICRAYGVEPVALMPEYISPFPEAFIQAVANAVECSDPSGLRTHLSRGSLRVLFIDNYDQLASLDTWIREIFWPAIPKEVRIVIGSRSAPSVRWQSYPVWSKVACAMELQAFSQSEAKQFLQIGGIPLRHLSIVWQFTRGHPLALALAAESLRRDEKNFEPSKRLDIIDSLVEWFIERVLSTRHRRALQVACLIQQLDEQALMALMDSDPVGDLFIWLQTLSFVHTSGDNIAVHELVRRVLLSQLAIREQVRLAQLLVRGTNFLVSELDRASDFETRMRLAILVGSMCRHHPVFRHFKEDEVQGLDIKLGRGTQLAELPALVEHHYGIESARIARRWLQRQDSNTWLIQDAQALVRGFVMLLMIEGVTARRAANWDPIMNAALSYLDRRKLLQAGDRLLVHRYIMNHEDIQGSTGVMQRCLEIITYIHHWYPRRCTDLVHSFLVVSDPQPWEDIFRFSDYEQLEGDYIVPLGARNYTLFYHSFRECPPDQWAARCQRRLATMTVE